MQRRYFLLIGILVVVGEISALGQSSEETDWITLFDGSSLSAWKSYRSEGVPTGWLIENDTLVHKAGDVDLVTREEFSDFDLRFEWQIAPGGNSGVIYRCDEEDLASYMTGPEYQLLDNAGWQLSAMHIQASGALYGLYEPDKDAVRPTGKWNTSRIVAKQNHVEHWLNGKQVVSAEWGSHRWQDKVSGSKFAEWRRFGTLPRGRIALQAHEGRNGADQPVWFRNIKIRRLSESEK